MSKLGLDDKERIMCMAVEFELPITWDTIDDVWEKLGDKDVPFDDDELYDIMKGVCA